MLSRTLTFRVRKPPTSRGLCPICKLWPGVSSSVLRCLLNNVRACLTNECVLGTRVSGLAPSRCKLRWNKFLVLSSNLILLRLSVTKRVPHLCVSRLSGLVSLVTGNMLVTDVSFPSARSVCRNLLSVRNGMRLVVRLRKWPRSVRRALVLPWKTLSSNGLSVVMLRSLLLVSGVLFPVKVRVCVVKWLILPCRCRVPVVNLPTSLGSNRSVLLSNRLIVGLGVMSRLSI